MNNKKCENCKHFRYTPNIIGGISECLLEVKGLNTFWPNNACDKYAEARNAEIPDLILFDRIGESIKIIEEIKNN